MKIRPSVPASATLQNASATLKGQNATSFATAINRRRALFLGLGVGTCAVFPTTSAMAQAVSRRREPLWGTLELNLGVPTKLIPQADVLNMPVETTLRYGREFARWHELVTRAGALSADRQLDLVHSEIQKISYRPDGGPNGTADNWAHPLKFMRSGGDCEDYAVAKFKTLEAAGFPSSNMRLAIVRNETTTRFHAVLVAYIDGRASILDSQSANVYPQAEQTAYDPICSLDGKRLWLHWNGSGLKKRVALLKARLGLLA